MGSRGGVQGRVASVDVDESPSRERNHLRGRTVGGGRLDLSWHWDGEDTGKPSASATGFAGHAALKCRFRPGMKSATAGRGRCRLVSPRSCMSTTASPLRHTGRGRQIRACTGTEHAGEVGTVSWPVRRSLSALSGESNGTTNTGSSTWPPWLRWASDASQHGSPGVRGGLARRPTATLDRRRR